MHLQGKIEKCQFLWHFFIKVRIPSALYLQGEVAKVRLANVNIVDIFAWLMGGGVPRETRLQGELGKLQYC